MLSIHLVLLIAQFGPNLETALSLPRESGHSGSLSPPQNRQSVMMWSTRQITACGDLDKLQPFK